MDRISREWVNGAFDFFATMKPDPWERINNDVEFGLAKYPSVETEDERQAILARYESSAIELLGLYRRLKEIQNGAPPIEMSISDAFFRGLGGETPQLTQPPPPVQLRADPQDCFFPPQ